MNTPEKSPATSTIPHVLSPQEQAAVAAARLAGRPLLVRGEPGVVEVVGYGSFES